MRTTLISLVAAIALAPSPVSAQRGQAQPSSTDLILAIDARRTTESGTSSAGDHGNTSFSSYTYATASDLCGLGTGDDEPARTPWIGWYYTGEILGSSVGAAGPELNVRINWERRWSNGARTTDGPRGTNTVTMRAGDVLVLDRVTPAGPGRCGDELRLEASVMTSSSRFRGMRGMAGGRGGFAAAGGGGGMGRGSLAGGGGRGSSATVAGTAGATGAGAGRTTGVTTAGRGRGGATGASTTAGAGTGTTAVAGRGGRAGGAAAGGTAAAAGGAGTTAVAGRGGGRGGAASATGGVGTTGTAQSAPTGRGGRGSVSRETTNERLSVLRGMFTPGATHTAEVWLLHRTPDNVEHVQQQTIPFGGAGREFTFPPVAVNTSRGVVMVDITGSLRVTDARIAIGLGRRARASGTPALDTTGTSEMTFELPKPEEVLSFEFPALQKPAEDLLAKHKFSIRVRIK